MRLNRLAVKAKARSCIRAAHRLGACANTTVKATCKSERAASGWRQRGAGESGRHPQYVSPGLASKSWWPRRGAHSGSLGRLHSLCSCAARVEKGRQQVGSGAGLAASAAVCSCYALNEIRHNSWATGGRGGAAQHCTAEHSTAGPPAGHAAHRSLHPLGPAAGKQQLAISEQLMWGSPAAGAASSCNLEG